MVRVLSDRIRTLNAKPGRKVLRDIDNESVGQYPKTFEDTLNGTGIATGLETLLWKLENCINNKKRQNGELVKRKTEDDEDGMNVKNPKLQRDSYGCFA